MTRTEDVDVTDELIPEHALHQFARALLGSAGVPDDQAGVVADVLVYADLRGVDSHGVHLLSLYLDRIASGDLAPVTEVTVVRDETGTYTIAWFGAAALCVVAAALSVGIRRDARHPVAV